MIGHTSSTVRAETRKGIGPQEKLGAGRIPRHLRIFTEEMGTRVVIVVRSGILGGEVRWIVAAPHGQRPQDGTRAADGRDGRRVYAGGFEQVPLLDGDARVRGPSVGLRAGERGGDGAGPGPRRPRWAAGISDRPAAGARPCLLGGRGLSRRPLLTRGRRTAPLGRTEAADAGRRISC